MKPAAHGLAAATLAAAFALAPGLALAQTTSTQNTPGQAAAGQAGMSQPGMGQAGMGQSGMSQPGSMAKTTGMAAPGGQGMTPGTQAGTPAASGDDNQAVATTPNNAMTPAHGANSFTRGEVSRRLASRGFTHATGLKKDNNGVWRGQAMHAGATMGVWVDYKGNIGADTPQ